MAAADAASGRAASPPVRASPVPPRCRRRGRRRRRARAGRGRGGARRRRPSWHAAGARRRLGPVPEGPLCAPASPAVARGGRWRGPYQRWHERRSFALFSVPWSRAKTRRWLSSPPAGADPFPAAGGTIRTTITQSQRSEPLRRASRLPSERPSATICGRDRSPHDRRTHLAHAGPTARAPSDLPPPGGRFVFRPDARPDEPRRSAWR